MLKSPVIKRSIACHGHQTSVSLENEFWDHFRAQAQARGLLLCELYEQYVETCPPGSSVTSHIRTSILNAIIEQVKTHAQSVHGSSSVGSDRPAGVSSGLPQARVERRGVRRR